MEEITITVSARERREITQKEVDDLLHLCEEFFWIDWIDKFIVKDN